MMHYEPNGAVSVPANTTKTVMRLDAPSGSIIETTHLLLVINDAVEGEKEVYADGVSLGIVADEALLGSRQRSQIGDYGRPHPVRIKCRRLELVVWNEAPYEVHAHPAVDYETTLRTLFQPYRDKGFLSKYLQGGRR